MNKRIVLNAVLCAALAGTAAASQAASVTLTGWTFGAGHNVNTSAPAYAGRGGGFTGSLTDAGAFDAASFQTYCVELTESFHFGSTPMTGYDVVAGDLYFGAASATKIGKLVSFVQDNVGAVDTSAESTSMQLALWNLIYDGDSSLASGSFTDTSTHAAYANVLLAGSQALASSAIDVFALRKAGSQDFLLTAHRVPEPGSLALGLLGLAGLIASRRRPAR